MKPYSYTANALQQSRSACPEDKIRQHRFETIELSVALTMMFGKVNAKRYNHKNSIKNVVEFYE